MSEQQIDVTQSEAVRIFAECAGRYCTLLEHPESYSRGRFLWALAKASVELYHAGLQLPRVGEFEISQIDVDWKELNARLAGVARGDLEEKFDEYKAYYRRHEPQDYDIVLLIENDLDETYWDVGRGFLLYKEGTIDSIRNAVWEWTFGFQHHWGRHLVRAIKALHWMISDHLYAGDE